MATALPAEEPAGTDPRPRRFSWDGAVGAGDHAAAEESRPPRRR
ncbi:MAG: hypothetical protein AVDCRST_MAG52-600 [uncultured Blastococcus sp.]|uniref:Uncharacterized protein n=1 Tax=uncultured Blastococcus sp. TaxID=217144 RepID=A0A6J4HCI1_9ACTN|nr:MAG: hypothetical protein AVDCRST_MAG52-600 [uncultured Blastococcus sp.]